MGLIVFAKQEIFLENTLALLPIFSVYCKNLAAYGVDCHNIRPKQSHVILSDVK